MGKHSRKANSLRVIQGGKAGLGKSTRALTHEDIKELLAKFAEAILVDQKRVDKLPREKFHPLYDDGFWRAERESYVGAIVDLSMTVDKMPKSLLKRLTKLAVTYRTETVKLALINITAGLGIPVVLVTPGSSPWLYETASVFFNELIEDVSRRGPGISPRGNPVKMILQWFDYDDPVAIAKDGEYADLLDSHIKRESEKTRNALAVQGRLAFIEMRAAKEFCNHLYREA
jgi:hypothetical protein